MDELHRLARDVVQDDEVSPARCTFGSGKGEPRFRRMGSQVARVGPTGDTGPLNDEARGLPLEEPQWASRAHRHEHEAVTEEAGGRDRRAVIDGAFVPVPRSTGRCCRPRPGKPVLFHRARRSGS